MLNVDVQTERDLLYDSRIQTSADAQQQSHILRAHYISYTGTYVGYLVVKSSLDVCDLDFICNTFYVFSYV